MRRQGLVLVSTLLMTVVVTMMVTALVGMARTDLANTSQYRDRLRAREMALGGLQHVMYRWTYQPGLTSDVSWQVEDESYLITFNPASADRSVNNLQAVAESTTPGVLGNRVFGGHADVICVGRAGASRVRLHALVARGFNFNRAVGSAGRIVLAGDCQLDGIKALTDPQPSGGGLFSDFVSTAGVPAIEWDGSGTFEMLNNTELTVRPPASGDPLSASLTPWSSRLKQSQAPGLQIPDLDVPKMVASKASAPAPLGLTSSGGVNYLPPTGLSDDRYVDGDLVVNGDLVLGNGSLYVKGKLEINGGISGVGSVYADGDVQVKGGTSTLQTNQSSGAALFASGGVSLEGLSAAGYLDSLQAAHPALATPRAQITNKLADITNQVTALDPADPASYVKIIESHHASSGLGGGDTISAGCPHQDYWVNPIPGPDGARHSWGNRNYQIPGLITAIQSELGPAYATDAKAQRIVQGLEELHNQFRFNYINVEGAVDSSYHLPGVTELHYQDPAFTPPTSAQIRTGWDDNQLLPVPDTGGHTQWLSPAQQANYPFFSDLSLDHKYRAVVGPVWSPMEAAWPAAVANITASPALRGLVGEYKADLETFLELHPLDFSWLGSSNLQGLVYARGPITISNDFQVIGSVMSRSQVTLSGGSRLVYNEEYFRQRGSLGPMCVISLEEL